MVDANSFDDGVPQIGGYRSSAIAVSAQGGIVSDQLPVLDEHRVTISAPVDAVWSALHQTLTSVFSRPVATVYARAVGCAETTVSGEALAPGATIPGFAVVDAAPPTWLLLEGRHRFSTYALRFRIDEVGPHCSELRAETRALFPGTLGVLYRTVVIRSGFHVIAVRRLLSAVRRRADQPQQ
jgi:hypothetical protein